MYHLRLNYSQSNCFKVLRRGANTIFLCIMHCYCNRDKIKQANCAICECGGKFIPFSFPLNNCN